MPSELPKEFDSGKIYLLRGSTLNKILEAINTRTPLVQYPLTATDDPAGVLIAVPTVVMKVCIEGEGEELEEQDAEVCGSLVSEAE
jgi:hypothetical protein